MRIIYHFIKRFSRVKWLLFLLFLSVSSVILLWERLVFIQRTHTISNELNDGRIVNKHDKKHDWMNNKIQHKKPTQISLSQTVTLSDKDNKENENILSKLLELNDNNKDEDQLSIPVDYLSTKYLRQFVTTVNKEQRIYNQHLFPKRDLLKGAIIIVQVHKRLEYFVNLLKSLKASTAVKDVLLIISHDFISDELNAAVKEIKFCQFMQIFFPYSVQLHPLEYPGTDPNDCPRDATKSKAKELQCNNAEHPDKYGHYREAGYAMTKLHWWWKANMIFEHLNVTHGHNGPFVMLEEDHHIAPDFFDVLNKLNILKHNHPSCVGTCDLVSLGSYVEVTDYSNGADEVRISTWQSSSHNMAMTIYRNAWETMKKCGEKFCTYDDYNWDWSLMKMSLHCFTRPLSVLAIALPRVFHVGKCGMHHKLDCNVEGPAAKLQTLFDINREFLFQSKLSIVSNAPGASHVAPESGGWGDTRDHQLCINFMYDLT